MSMQYKVKVLYLSGKGNKVFNSGDLVTQAQLASDAEELVKGGFIEPVTDDETETQTDGSNTTDENGEASAEETTSTENTGADNESGEADEETTPAEADGNQDTTESNTSETAADAPAVTEEAPATKGKKKGSKAAK